MKASLNYVSGWRREPQPSRWGLVTSFWAASLSDCISRVENRLGGQPSHSSHAPAHTGDTVGKPKGNFGVTQSAPEAKKKIERAWGGGDQAHESKVGSHRFLALYGIVSLVWVRGVCASHSLLPLRGA